MGELAEGAPAPWHVLAVRPAYERSAARRCEEIGLPTWLPLTAAKVKWSDRQHVTRFPLLPGYLFARLPDRDAFIEALGIVGVMRILPSNLNPTPIADQELAAFRAVVESGVDLRLCAHVAGSKIVVQRGPLAGQRGVVVRSKTETRLVVSIEMLNRAVSVELDSACVAAEGN